MRKPFLSLLAALTLLTAACDNLNKQEAKTKDEPQEATQDTAVVYRDGQTAGDATASAAATAGNAVAGAFDVAKDKLKDIKFEEVNLPDISVRGNDDYSVYGLEEKVLFDTDKAEIKPGAANALNQVVASIGQRYGSNQIQVMGFADSRGDKDYNKELSEKRAEAVRNWLVTNGKMDASRLSVEPMGEAMPAASNATAAGRKENRRVEIAVRTKA
ncbi:OmpA family protein [uncultured Hymenobacter sp.]|uniref:OmpA family protein n=1 Tax=uncultured Hymenobacter sp. TaxID=170016 RepID=UPI0035C9B597